MPGFEDYPGREVLEALVRSRSEGNGSEGDCAGEDEAEDEDEDIL